MLQVRVGGGEGPVREILRDVREVGQWVGKVLAA